MTVQAVIFDVGGVLLTLGEAEYRNRVAKLLGQPSMPGRYEESIPSLQRGEMMEEALWAELAGRPVNAEEFDREWLELFRPVPEMLALAAELRRRGVRTGVLSNTQGSHVRLMRRMGFLDGFDPVTLSCETGCRKPEPAVFQTALDRLRLEPAAVAFIDDVPEYVEAARHLGMHGILHQGDVEATRCRVLALVRQG